MRLQLVLLAALVVIGAVAARAAHRFLPALNDPAPPLAQAPPWRGVSTPPLARKVVLVVVDGLRDDASRTMATLERLTLRGARTRARAGFPTISKANYLTLMAGVQPRYSGARTNDRFRKHAVDSLFARARSPSYVADRTRGIARLFGVDDAQVASAADANARAFDAAYARSDLTVWFFIAVDEAGHAYGGASAGYLDMVRDVDERLAHVLARVDLDRDALVITSDHGHTDSGGHGGIGADVEIVPLVLAGAGVRSGGHATNVSMVDVAPTVAALLGIPAPGHGTGRTLVELLEVGDAARDALLAADAQRLAHVRAILKRINHDDASTRRAALLVRIPLAIITIAALVAVLVMLARRKRVEIDRWTLAASPVLLIVFALAVFVVDRGRMIPGVPSSATALWAKTAVYAGSALVVHVIVAVAVLAARRSAERAAGLAVTGVAVAATGALAAWSLVGLPLATMLPGPALVIVSPVAYIALAYQAVASVLVLSARAVAGRTKLDEPDGRTCHVALQ